MTMADGRVRCMNSAVNATQWRTLAASASTFLLRRNGGTEDVLGVPQRAPEDPRGPCQRYDIRRMVASADAVRVGPARRMKRVTGSVSPYRVAISDRRASTVIG